MHTGYKSNIAVSTGIIKELPVFSHCCYNEEFYKAILSVCRSSGVYDSIEVLVSEKLYPMKNICIDDNLRIEGEYRSKNYWENGKNRLMLSLFAQSVELIIDREPIFENIIAIEGFICKQVVYRRTPLNREIADIMLAVNRRNGRSDYIPCIAWGRNAVFASSLSVGTKVRIVGRIQSRKYLKITEDGQVEKVANEVSVSELEIAE